MPTHDFSDIGDVLNFQLLKGIIATIDSATDTCEVAVGGDIVTALLYYHCTPTSELRSNGAISGAAKGFAVGDEVIVLINKEKTTIKVIGHTDGIRRCAEDFLGNYYIFYVDGTTLKIANCTYDNVIEVQSTQTYDKIATQNFSSLIAFNLKRFTHNVPASGVTTARDLYFVATSLYLNPNPYPGWVNFSTANPTFPLVTNKGNTNIPMTPQLLADLNTVNYDVNHAHAHIIAPNDNWHIMSPGESGDCNEFALTKADVLADLGYPASALHIECGIIPSTKVGHTWLVVQTTGGDYALDMNSDTVQINSSLKWQLTDEDFICRRRQIGSNWASITPYAWLTSSTNTDRMYWYILDPLLNIFYLIPDSPPYQPFQAIINNITAYTEISGPSINFSENNNSIHIAYDGMIKTYKLNENELTLVSQSAYTSAGFVGRDGLIVEPEGIYGRKDPFDWSDGSVFNFQYPDGVWNLFDVLTARRGSFRCLGDYQVTSENGYYSYKYNYLVGVFLVVGNGTPGDPATVLIEWADPERPEDILWHMKTIFEGDIPGDYGGGFIGTVMSW